MGTNVRMRYNINPKNGDEISALSFGGMRLPKEQQVVNRIISSAVEMGINYFDTAYIYVGNEEKLGKAFAAAGVRDKIKIATKIPPYMFGKTTDMDKIFYRQTERLRTDYFDYYMAHMLSDISVWERLLSLGFDKWAENKKKKGEIKNFGFSFHGGLPAFTQLIDAYPWDFTMIQYNYMDEFNQAGRNGLRLAAERGIPVIAMEPLRGGTLVNLPKAAQKVVDSADIKRTSVEWGLAWCLNQKELLTTLSGMQSEDQLIQNVSVVDKTAHDSLTERDFDIYRRITAAINANMFVGCTGCGYCMPCPASVDIPLCFSCLNDIKIKGAFQSRIHYILRTDKRNASLCVSCRKCEKHCPQGLKISQDLRLVSEKLEGFLYKPMRMCIRRIMRY